MFPRTWYLSVAVLAVLHLCLLRYSPHHKSCWSCRLQLYATQIFFLLFFYISLFWNLEICSYLFLLFFPMFLFALYLDHPSILFYSSFCSLFRFLPLYLFTLFSEFSYCFLFKSAILYFLISFPITLFCLLLPYVLLLFNLFSFC